MIVIDGGSPPAGWGRLVASGATVVAADGGMRHARHEGVAVTDLVGDFDSLSGDEVRTAAAAGARVHRYPRDKDYTDFALAARLVARRAADGDGSDRRVLVVGGTGGRIDHELGNFAVLAGPELAPMATTAVIGRAVIHVVHSGATTTVFGGPGATVSVVAFGGTAHGVTTTGLVFVLDDDDLPAGSSRGISNRLAAQGATVRVGDGVVFVIEPDGAGDLFETLSGGQR